MATEKHCPNHHANDNSMQPERTLTSDSRLGDIRRIAPLGLTTALKRKVGAAMIRQT
jgi:hypothetical protein